MKALCLSGGGSHGAFEVGVLKKLLLEEKRQYDIITGISVGAINGACLAQFKKEDAEKSWQELSALWSRVSTSKIRKFWFGWYLAALWKSSVYNTKPLKDWVYKELDPALIHTSGRKLRISAVSADKGETITATEDFPDIRNWVLASSAFPVMFQPIEISGQNWVDGGIRSVTPLAEAVRAGADDIDIIMCSNPNLIKQFNGKSNVPKLALRCIDLMINQIERDDLKVCQLKNKIEGYKQIKTTLIQPFTDLEDIMSSLDFDQDKVQKMITLGYEEACKTLKS
jgi:NTE family protein